MNTLQFTPLELVSLIAELVRDAVAKAVRSHTPVEGRSVAAVRQARYRQRVK